MCSTKWDYADEPDTLADVSAIANAISVDVHAVQTDVAGTQIAAKTVARYLDACCTDSNSCVIYNFSNGDNVVGYTLDALASTTTVCPGGVCEEVLDWNILEVRTAAGNGGGSALSSWGSLADLFGCDLSSQIGPSQARALYDHNNTRGVPINHIGGFLDQVDGSDQLVLDAGWFFLPWHNDGAVAYHSSGARNTTVEWCGDGNNLAWDWDYFGNWCQDEDVCSSNYGTMFGGHSMAFCPMLMENSDHYDQKMAYIDLMGQITTCTSDADCNDGDPCTNDSCNGDNICTHTANTSPCDDGLFCTTGEVCTAGICGGGSATDCSGSGDQCNTGSCNETSDACEASPANEGSSCDDSDLCSTGETCSSGSCTGGSTTNCSGLDDQCNTGVCNAGTGNCETQAANEGGSCDDGLFCSTGETCGSGACGGGGATNCSDGVGCTTDSCNESTDTCDSTPVHAACDNGQFCDGAETCDAALDCQAGGDPCPGQGCDEPTDQCLTGPAARLEANTVSVGGTPVTVVLENLYANPVVACTVQYANNTTPVVTRVSAVGSASFQVRLQNPSGGAVATDNVHCLVVEEGTWTMDGVNIEAQTYLSTVTDRKSNWVGQAQSYGQAYTNPVVIGQVMTENDPNWSYFWARGGSRQSPPSASVLFTGKGVAEDSLTSRADETVGFIVFEAGHGTIAGVEFEAALGADTVRGTDNSPPYGYAYATPFAASPTVAVASQAAVDGNDGSWAQAHGATLSSATTLFMSVDEDQIGGAERSHTTEQVSYAVFAGPVVYPPASSCTEGQPCDDGNACTTGDTCTGGVCAGSATDCSGLDDQCNTGACNSGTGNCEAQATNEGLPCDDGLFCNAGESCTTGSCGGGGATDCSGSSDQCNTGSCNEATNACEAVASNEGGSCDDGLFCNAGESCTTGSCGGGSATDCSGSGDQCNTGACNETADACEAVASNEGGGCDDGDLCSTGETCSGGACSGGATTDCSGLDDQCNTGVCNAGTGNCEAQAANEGLPCDDGLFCNAGETCAAGSCTGGGAADCSDGVVCTTDSCNEGTDVCDSTPVDAACDDGQFCDGAETCSATLDCQLGADPCPGQGCNEATDQCLAGPIAMMEAGTVAVGGSPVTVMLANSYTSPVVACTVQYNNNTTPVVTRVSAVGSASFQLRLQNPSGGAVATDNVNCVIVEEGTWTIDGVNIEAQTYLSTVTDRKSNWVGQAQSYGQAYSNPVVIGQVMTENDADWSHFWARGSSRQNPPSAGALYTGKGVAEDTTTSRADETVGFIVFEAGHGTIGGVEFEAALGADSVRGTGNSPPYGYAYSTSFAASPTVAVTSQSGMDGNDGGWAQTHGVTVSSAGTLFLSIDEDQISGNERSHTTEQVSYAAFAGPMVYP
jgi:hypothetical protein